MYCLIFKYGKGGFVFFEKKDKNQFYKTCNFEFMKRTFLYSFLLITLIACISGCSQEKISEIKIENLNSEQQKALNLITSFRNRLNPNESRSRNNLKILDVEKSSIAFKKKGDTDGKFTRGYADENIEDVSIYTFRFEKNGERGFSISSPDQRIDRVLAYVENGEIADTAFISGMAQMIHNIVYACAEDLDEYYSGIKRIQSRATKRVIYHQVY